MRYPFHTIFKGKENTIAVSIDRPGSSRSDRSSVDSSNSMGASLPGGVSPIIMSRFFSNSPKRKMCTMDCGNCRSIAKQLREEQNNRLDLPGRRGSTPWSAPCSRKSSLSPGVGMRGKYKIIMTKIWVTCIFAVMGYLLLLEILSIPMTLFNAMLGVWTENSAFCSIMSRQQH